MAKTLRVALVQFDAKPEQVDGNLREMRRLCRRAAADGAELVMFHEGTICDYTRRVAELAEPAPDGPSCRSMARLAKSLGIYISFGLSEVDRDRYYITQVFLAPHGYLYRYRKTWLWAEHSDKGYRHEHARYDPGDGPELFEIAGIRATCYICADSSAPRCIKRAAALKPELVFFPNNRLGARGIDEVGPQARQIGAAVLVTNRVGMSWVYDCAGGCMAVGPDGRLIAAANAEGREEILHCKLKFAR